MSRVSSIDDRMIGEVFSFSSEELRRTYLVNLNVVGNLYAFLSLALDSRTNSLSMVPHALDLVLRRKAIGIEAMSSQRDSILEGRHPEMRERLRELTRLRMKIAQKTLAGPGGEGLASHQQLLSTWNLQKERLEAELAGVIPAMDLLRRLRSVDHHVVARLLSANGVLVEFVRCPVYNFSATPLNESRWKPDRYLAFVLPGGKPAHVRLIDLGDAELIDRMVAEFRDSIIGESGNSTDRDMMHKRQTHKVETSHVSDGLVLRAALFDKVVPALSGRKWLLLAPDGNLAQLPFELLPTDDGRQLIDKYDISYVSCGRDVLRFGAVSDREPGSPLVVCDPDFDLCREGYGPSTETGLSRSRRSRDLPDAAYHFDRLPATRLEGERIGALLGVTPWREADSLEGRLKEQCRSPRILHLATHGFFLKDQEYDRAPGRRDLGMLSEMTAGLGRLSGPLPENLLLRSGLALAGANTWLRKGNLPAEAEDGLLTAEDVTGLDLLDTELVVLSACETGLGEVRVGEGVFGLRRAFVLAGAKTLVMSLWKVEDDPTRELMEDFYRRIMAGQGRADALRGAQISLKAKYPEPFYWGAFICQGDPGPLEGHRGLRQRPAKNVDEREFS